MFMTAIKYRYTKVASNGLLPGLSVIGFHGSVSASSTPALRSPIYVDKNHYRVDVVSPSSLFEAIKPRGDGVRLRVSKNQLYDGQLPGEWTRIGPWAARLNYSVIEIGMMEKKHMDGLIARLSSSSPIACFLRWHAREEKDNHILMANRMEDGGGARYSSNKQIIALMRAIAGEARYNLFMAARRSDSELVEYSWWLNNAALKPSDVLLSAAGLKIAGDSAWECVFRGSKQDEAAVKRAENRILKQPHKR